MLWLAVALVFIDRFFMSFVNLLGSKPKAVYGAAAEVVGMAMAQMEETNNVRDL